MKTALILIATGEKYHQFIRPLLGSAKKFFVEHTPVLWTDSTDTFVQNQFFLKDEGFPKATLHRYHTFYTHAGYLSEFDQIFYCDIDMRFVSPVYEGDIFSQGITATLHPGFFVNHFDRNGDYVTTKGTPERHTDSAAYIEPHSNNRYFCGGFNGGDCGAFLRMADQIRLNIDLDRERKGQTFHAIWNDESHLNRYLFDNPPARVLTPSFCWPEDYDDGYGWSGEKYPAKLIALDKRKYWR